MEIVVNDTNIFIDLYSIGLLESFFLLPINVHTVDFVLNELTEKEQFSAVNRYINEGKLLIRTFNSNELVEIADLQMSANGNVSFTDCAVWYYAQNNNYTLLTGDSQLRKRAIESNVSVKGIIYIVDLLLEYNIIPSKLAAKKLQELLSINSRLPRRIIQDRIETWSR